MEARARIGLRIDINDAMTLDPASLDRVMQLMTDKVREWATQQGCGISIVHYQDCVTMECDQSLLPGHSRQERHDGPDPRIGTRAPRQPRLLADPVYSVHLVSRHGEGLSGEQAGYAQRNSSVEGGAQA